LGSEISIVKLKWNSKFIRKGLPADTKFFYFGAQLLRPLHKKDASPIACATT